MNALNKTIKECCDKFGMSYVFARLDGEANVIIDALYKFPALVRSFAERINESANGLTRSREVLFYFCDIVGQFPDTMTQVSDTIDRMEVTAFEFIEELRGNGLEVTVTNSNTAISRFDKGEAGIMMNLTINYTVC